MAADNLFSSSKSNVFYSGIFKSQTMVFSFILTLLQFLHSHVSCIVGFLALFHFLHSISSVLLHSISSALAMRSIHLLFAVFLSTCSCLDYLVCMSFINAFPHSPYFSFEHFLLPHCLSFPL